MFSIGLGQQGQHTSDGEVLGKASGSKGGGNKYLGSTPHPRMPVANEGLGPVEISLLKMLCHPGGYEPASWVRG